MNKRIPVFGHPTGLEFSHQTRLAEFTWTKWWALRSHHSMMLEWITTKSSGEFISKMKTWCVMWTKQRNRTTKWAERFSTSKTTTRTHLFPKSWPSLTSSFTGFASNSISRSCCWRPRKDKPGYSRAQRRRKRWVVWTAKPTSSRRPLIKALRLQIPRTGERSTSEGPLEKSIEPTFVLTMAAVSSLARREVRTFTSR